MVRVRLMVRRILDSMVDCCGRWCDVTEDEIDGGQYCWIGMSWSTDCVREPWSVRGPTGRRVDAKPVRDGASLCPHRVEYPEKASFSVHPLTC